MERRNLLKSTTAMAAVTVEVSTLAAKNYSVRNKESDEFGIHQLAAGGTKSALKSESTEAFGGSQTGLCGYRQ